jgi:hypothetical protein
VPGHPNAAIDTLNAGRGRHLAGSQTFVGWHTSAGVPQGFPQVFANYVAGLGATPMITWQLQDTMRPGQSPARQLDFALAWIPTAALTRPYGGGPTRLRPSTTRFTCASCA